jgi:hypothetical protein
METPGRMHQATCNASLKLIVVSLHVYSTDYSLAKQCRRNSTNTRYNWRPYPNDRQGYGRNTTCYKEEVLPLLDWYV